MTEVDPIFKVKRGNYVYPVGHWGHMAYIAGNPGAGKSTHVTYMAAAALRNDWVLGYHIDLQDRNVVVIDGEQPPDLYMRSYRRIGELCEGQNMDRLIFPKESLASISDVKERRKLLFEILRENSADLGVVLIDRVGNFVADVNHAREVGEFHRQLNKITELRNCLMIQVCHVTTNKFTYGNDIKLYGVQGSIIKQSSSWGLYFLKQSKYFGCLGDKTRYGAFPPLWAQYKEDGLRQEPYHPF